MTLRNNVSIYVDSPMHGASTYARLLDRQPVELGRTFASSNLDSGLKLDMWSRYSVAPAASHTGGPSELGWSVDKDQKVNGMYVAWCRPGIPILQAPVDQDFGRTFAAHDPDGHRLRILALIRGEEG